MGWTICRDRLDCPVPEFLRRSFTFERPGKVQDVIDLALVGSVWYAAIRVRSADPAEGRLYITPTNFTAGVVILTRGSRRAGFGWKAIGEDEGPCEGNCPAPILRLLSPLAASGSQRRAWATAWRDRCEASLGATALSPTLL